MEKEEQLEPKLLRRELFRVKCPKRIVAGDPYYFETVPPERLKKLVADYTLPKSYEARLVSVSYTHLEYGIDRQRIYSFRRRGWSLEDAMQMCINDVRGLSLIHI